MSDGAGARAHYIGIERLDARAQVTLRADLEDDAVAAAVSQATGLGCPGRLSVLHEGATRIVWMSPDELLLITKDGSAPGLVDALDAALAGHHHMTLDVSDARAIFRLTGAEVGEVLAKGAPCDLSDRACSPGTARRTHLAGLAVGLWRLAPDEWEIVCFRSYAHHLEAWLHTAAAAGAEVG